MVVAYPHKPTWERTYMIEEKVRLRRERAVAAFKASGIPYAVIGGNAVANWVSRIDESLVRNTRDVDVMIRREDLPALIPAMAKEGWFHNQVTGVDLFIEGEKGKPSEGIHLLFAGEKVRPTDAVEIPTMDEVEETEQFCVVSLEGLIRMKLLAFRDKDRTHIRDLIGVGLVNEFWPAKFPPPLNDRLQSIFDTPNG